MQNKYSKHSRISERKFREVLHCFCLDLTASDTAILTRLSRNSINKLYAKLRLHILRFCLLPTVCKGEFELDESYFGAKRVRGKRGRGAAGKTPVFGLLKRDGKVRVEIVENCSKSQLMPIIQGHILEGSTIHTDGWKAYDGLVLNGYTHHRVFHSHDEFARGKCHVNGIESFWSFAKRRMAKFNGLTDEKFYLHLKECEFRFNVPKKDTYARLLKSLRKNPI
jgi:transposase